MTLKTDFAIVRRGKKEPAITTTPWATLPHSARTAEGAHIFAIGDVHGRGDLLAPLIDHLKVAAAGSAGRTEIVFTGDLTDRGSDNIQAVELAMGVTGFDTRIVLPGNHEMMFFEAMEHGTNFYVDHWVRNGGREVLAEINALRDPSLPQSIDTDEIKAHFPAAYWKMIATGQTFHQSGDLTFVHAGIHPRRPVESSLADDRFEVDRYHWAWIRNGFIDHVGPWPGDAGNRRIVVHGHTIEQTESLSAFDDPEFPGRGVADQRRINIDAGAYFFNNMVSVEIADDLFRFHVSAGAARPRPERE